MAQNDKNDKKKKNNKAVPLADDELKSVSAGQQHVDQTKPVDFQTDLAKHEHDDLPTDEYGYLK